MLQARYRREYLEETTPESFQDIASLAAILCSDCSFRIQFLDYAWSWTKYHTGPFEPELESTCTFSEMIALCNSSTYVVNNINADKNLAGLEFFKHPFEFKFWAAFPCVDSQGKVTALFHILAPNAQQFNDQQIHGLEILATMIARRIEANAKAKMNRRSLEEKYEKQTEFLDAVLESLNDGVVACDANGRLSVFNEATRKFHGLDSRQDITSEKWAEYFNLYQPDGKTLLKTEEVPLARAFSGEEIKDVEFVLTSKTGTSKNILSSGRAIYNSEGQKLGAVVTMHDVTAEKEAQAKLHATMKSVTALVDACPIGIVAMNVNGEYTLWNPGTEKIFGWNIHEANQRFSQGTETSVLDFRNLVKKVQTTLTQVEDDITLIRKDGKQIEVHLTLIPLFDEKNQYNGFLCVSVDISDIKMREANLLKSNTALQAASAAKSQFLATMSHEIRTPLNGIIGMTEIMLLSAVTEEQRHHLQIVHSSAQSLFTILTDILDFSKIEAGKIEIEKVPFDIRTIVNNLHESLNYSAGEKGLLLRKEILIENSQPLIGDPVRIRQVLLNLLTNALKFTENGEVKTSVAIIPLENGKSTLLIKVKDTGLGIDDTQKHRLFSAFTQADSSTTRKFGGSGLGLSICKGLIEHMGGDMGFESEKNIGSTFWFSLELEQANETVKPEPIRIMQIPTAQRSIRILIAEDNLVNQKIALGMLTKLGHQADVVEDGKAAVAALKEKTYDLILMDCQMPEMDGYEATRVIRKEAGLPNQIPIVALTANAMNGDKEKCLEAGMTDYLSKPLQAKNLLEILSRLLETNVIPRIPS